MILTMQRNVMVICVLYMFNWSSYNFMFSGIFLGVFIQKNCYIEQLIM